MPSGFAMTAEAYRAFLAEGGLEERAPLGVIHPNGVGEDGLTREVFVVKAGGARPHRLSYVPIGCLPLSRWVGRFSTSLSASPG